MQPSRIPAWRSALTARRRRRRSGVWVLLAALAWSGAAHPCSVQQLLNLPLERLLQLQVTSPRVGEER